MKNMQKIVLSTVLLGQIFYGGVSKGAVPTTGISQGHNFSQKVKLVCKDGEIENISLALLLDNFAYFFNCLQYEGCLEDVMENGFQFQEMIRAQDIRFLLAFLASSEKAVSIKPTSVSNVWHLADFLMLKARKKQELVDFFRQPGKRMLETLLKEAFEQKDVYGWELAHKLGLMDEIVLSMSQKSSFKASADGRHRLGKFPRRVQVEDVVTGGVILAVSCNGLVQTACVSPDGGFLGVVEIVDGKDGREQKLCIWNVQENKIIGEMKIKDYQHTFYRNILLDPLVFSPDGRWLFITSLTEVFDTEMGTWNELYCRIGSIVFSADGKRVANSTEKGIEVLDLAEPWRAALFQKKCESPRCVTFSNDGKKIAFLIGEVCEVYDIEARQLVASFKNVTSFYFLSPDAFFFVDVLNQGKLHYLETKVTI
jgi:hypothetical protein